MSIAPNLNKSTGRYLFICYSHRDVSTVEQEAEWLRRQGFRLWYDDNIAAGHPWSEELAEAIAGASGILFFLSTHSARSSYCVDELHFAKDKNIPIIPIEVEPVELSPGLQLTLGTKQFVRMSDTSARKYRNKLAAGLSALLAARQVAGPVGDFEEPTQGKPRLLRARLTAVIGAMATIGVVLLLS